MGLRSARTEYFFFQLALAEGVYLYRFEISDAI